MIICSSVLAPCVQMGYAAQLVRAPLVQLLPGVWGYSSAAAKQGFAAHFPCAEPSDCKTIWWGDVQRPGTGREQLRFPLAAGER